MTGTRGTVAGLVALAWLVGCGDDGASSLAWAPCPNDDSRECARLDVPLDYAEPAAGTVPVWALRSLADPAQRIGVLFVILGGPGDAGTENGGRQLFSLLSNNARLVESFDILFIDRRATGLSGPLTCADNQLFDDVRHTRFEPATSAEWSAIDEVWDRFGANCAVATSVAYLRSLSTETLARDLDAWRAALGEEQVSLLGYSYGTFAVATYAQRFPERVRAGVLDAALDWAPDLFTGNVEIGARTDANLRAFFDACSADATCEFHGGDSPANIAAAYDALEAELLADPPELVGSWQVGPRDLADQMYNLLRNGDIQGSLHRVAQQLAAAEAGDWSAVVTGAGGPGGGYDLDNLTAFYSIILADTPCAFTDIAGAQTALPPALATAPRLGAIRGSRAYACLGWPAPAATRQQFAATTAPPLLVFGGTHDVVTPFTGAQSVVTSLANGSYSVRYDGFAHPYFFELDGCVRTQAEAYLLDPGAYAPPASGACP